jgi:hypothetical protein
MSKYALNILICTVNGALCQRKIGYCQTFSFALCPITIYLQPHVRQPGHHTDI